MSAARVLIGVFQSNVPSTAPTMSLLLSGPGGSAVPVPSTLYGNVDPGAAVFPAGVSWQTVPASASLMSNIYSPVQQYPPYGTTPGMTYINNGSIATGPWTSNSVRAFNVVSQDGVGIIPPACMTPYPRQYMPSVMGSLSRMAAVVPPIALQNTWWPVNRPSVYPSLVADVTPSAASNAPVYIPPTAPATPPAVPATPPTTPVTPAAPTGLPAGAPAARAPTPTVILAQTAGAAPAPADSSAAMSITVTGSSAPPPPPYYVPDATLSYVPTYMNMVRPACAGNYVPWARPLQTAYVPYRPRYGFGV
jgi:hypothetical protein